MYVVWRDVVWRDVQSARPSLVSGVSRPPSGASHHQHRGDDGSAHGTLPLQTAAGFAEAEVALLCHRERPRTPDQLLLLSGEGEVICGTCSVCWMMKHGTTNTPNGSSTGTSRVTMPTQPPSTVSDEVEAQSSDHELVMPSAQHWYGTTMTY